MAKHCFRPFIVTVLTATAWSLLFVVQLGGMKVGSHWMQIPMARVNVSGYGNALSIALSDPILGLYTDNASAPLDVHAGLRQVYKFGLYKHCAYVNKTDGFCSGYSASHRFQPFKIITDDMPSNYSDYTDSIIHNTTFASSSLGRSSRAANALLLIGTIFSGLASLSSVVEEFCYCACDVMADEPFCIYIAGMAAFIGSIFVLIGATIWTVIVKRVGHINSFTLQPSQTPIGIHVSNGEAISFVWVAFACLVLSIGAMPDD